MLVTVQQGPKIFVLFDVILAFSANVEAKHVTAQKNFLNVNQENLYSISGFGP
jgi:hypothetical protein